MRQKIELALFFGGLAAIVIGLSEIRHAYGWIGGGILLVAACLASRMGK
jgi:hypothetical protein